jgi:hypothetical protein
MRTYEKSLPSTETYECCFTNIKMRNPSLYLVSQDEARLRIHVSEVKLWGRDVFGGVLVLAPEAIPNERQKERKSYPETHLFLWDSFPCTTSLSIHQQNHLTVTDFCECVTYLVPKTKISSLPHYQILLSLAMVIIPVRKIFREQRNQTPVL